MIKGNTVRFSAYTIDRDALGHLREALSGRRVAVISGERGWAAFVERMQGLQTCCHVRYGGECTMEAIGTATEAVSEAGAEVVLGVGGGKALDVAKAAAAQAGLPVYAVPTIAATCAAVTALSIVYHADGTLDRFQPLDAPPVHAYIDTALLAAAPARYFRAGLADAMAKHLEVTFSTRDERLDYVNSLGVEISRSIYDPLLAIGAQAYRDVEAGEATAAVADAVQRMIVSVGLTSLLVDERNNGAVAHSVCYGLGVIPGMEARVLHGERVGYGCLVQLAVDAKLAPLRALRAFLQEIGSPVTLREMGVAPEAKALAPVIAATLAGPDMGHLPYPVTQEMLLQAMHAVEALF